MCRCTICGNVVNNRLYIARESMDGLNAEFEYFKCSKCGCLQICKIPDNLSDYYTENYYSFHFSKNQSFKHKISNRLLEKSLLVRLGTFNFLGFFATKYKSYYRDVYPWIGQKYCRFDSKILDVGCGAGSFIVDLYDVGFHNIKGIDPFVSDTITYNNDKIVIEKKTIFDLCECFDFIMFNHSFEHMPDQLEVLKKVYDILNKEGSVLIRIPVIDNYFWRRYGMRQATIVAPNHLYLHSVESFSILIKKAGFKIDKLYFDANEYSFYASEKCKMGIPINRPDSIFTDRELLSFRKKAKELNSLRDSDHACFLLKKEI